jgi:hypothetical protein
MHTVSNLVGRLVEVRVASPLSLAEVDNFRQEHQAAIRDLPDRYVGAVDLRRADVFPIEVAQKLIAMLSGMAPLVERTGFLIGESAVFSLQIERILRNSASPQRKAFREPEQLKAFLGEVLTPLERSRLDAFLGEPLDAE